MSFEENASTALDNPETYRTFDPGAMGDKISELPTQLRYAWEISQEAALPKEYRRIRHIVVTGMGASALAADLLATLMASAGRVPLDVIRGYDLPAHVWGEDILVVGCSQSGDTEEVLSTFDQARERGAQLLAITAGGSLAALAESKDIYPSQATVWRFAYPSQSRAALGFSFALMLGLVCRLRLYPDARLDVMETADMLEAMQADLLPDAPTDHNVAKQIAQTFTDHLPVIFGAGFLGPVARRWRSQLNENAKQWAVWDTLPELNHNVVVGLDQPEAVRAHLRVVMLRSVLDHSRIKMRWEVTQELLTKCDIPYREVHGKGKTLIAQMFSLIHVGDFVSYYTAVLNGVDPTPVENAVYLKEHLSEL
jgi:glucose/mannose-6-phosphate isomerase